MKKKYTREGTFIGKYVEFTRLLLTHLNHFPKYEKYGLCQQIRNVNYDIYILMIECYKKYHKKSTLTQIDILISIIAHSKTTKTLEYIKNQFSKHPEIYKILPKQTKKLIKI